MESRLLQIANVDNKQALDELICNTEQIFKLVCGLKPALAGSFLDYYRETEQFKQLSSKYLLGEDMTPYDSACFALTIADIQEIDAEDLVTAVATLKDQHKDDAIIQSCLAGLSITALAINNDPQKTTLTYYFNWRDILSKRAQTTYVNLASANLAQALLNNVDFSGANFRNANLDGAKLERTVLNGANLEMAILTEAILLNARLEDANLQRANLSSIRLEQAWLKNANLRGAILTKANLTFANLTNADMRDTNLENCKLHGTCLDGVNLEGITKTAGAKLTGVSLRGANLKNADLQKMILRDELVFRVGMPSQYRADMTKANLEGANLEGFNLDHVFLIDAILTNARINQATLNGAVFFDIDDIDTESNIDYAERLEKNWTELNMLQGRIDGHPKIHELRQAIAKSLVTQAESTNDDTYGLKLLENATRHNVFIHRQMLSRSIAWGASFFVNESSVASDSQGIIFAGVTRLRTKIVANNKQEASLTAGLAKMSI